MVEHGARDAVPGGWKNAETFRDWVRLLPPMPPMTTFLLYPGHLLLANYEAYHTRYVALCAFSGLPPSSLFKTEP